MKIRKYKKEYYLADNSGNIICRKLTPLQKKECKIYIGAIKEKEEMLLNQNTSGGRF